MINKENGNVNTSTETSSAPRASAGITSGEEGINLQPPRNPLASLGLILDPSSASLGGTATAPRQHVKQIASRLRFHL